MECLKNEKLRRGDDLLVLWSFIVRCTGTMFAFGADVS